MITEVINIENYTLSFAEAIKQKRAEKGLSQGELANLFQPAISRATVNRWENGHVENIKENCLEQLCKIFNCEPIELKGLDYEAQIVAENYKLADSDTRIIIKKLLRL